MKKIFLGLACISFLSIGACTTNPKTDDNSKLGAKDPSDTGKEAQPVTKTEPKVIYSPSGPAPYNPYSVQPITPAQKSDPLSGVSSFDIVGIADRIYFATDSYQLSDEARAVVAEQASLLRANPAYMIIIEGNCDERGTREYNLALGARRANSVKDYLIAQGISPSRISTVSYGKERPIDERPSIEGWAINRNAHTVIIQ